jgi:hypothetical protein
MSPLGIGDALNCLSFEAAAKASYMAVDAKVRSCAV